VVAIAGAVASGHLYRDAFQEVDQQALFAPVTKKTWTLNQAARIPEMFREAFRTAMSHRRGPVALNIPRDLLAETIQCEPFQSPAQYRPPIEPEGGHDAVARAAALLAAAERPLIVTGGGIKYNRAYGPVLELAGLLGAPVATAPGHGDAIPFDHPLNAGQVGPRGNVVASALAKQADVILALGTRLGFNTTFYSWDNLNRGARIIHVEIEPTALGRYFPVELGIQGDAGRVAAQLARELRSHRPGDAPKRWLSKFAADRSKLLEERDAAGAALTDPIQPQTLFKVLRGVLPRDVMVTLDAGTLCLQATDVLNLYEPPCLFTPLDFGLVGFSYACGLGVKAACPDRTVVSLMGDGGFGMTLGELGTAVEHGLNTVVIVMNNHCWGAEKAYQRDFFGGRYLGADVRNPPFDKVAELFGAAGFRVERAADLERTVAAALACGKPAVVDIQVDPNALYSFRRDSFKHRAQ
jgi:acetolactate synthase-1/2/3 large subunit/sulfoacetaldehyde acetyltransferase